MLKRDIILMGTAVTTVFLLMTAIFTAITGLLIDGMFLRDIKRTII